MTTLAWNERRDRGYGFSLALAFAMHAILLGALFFGVRFQNFAPDTVSVELWEPPPAAPKLEPKPEPKPEPPPPKPEPEPPKPEPKLEKPEIVEKALPKPKPKPEPPKPEPKPKPKPEPAKPKAPPRDERAEKLMREQLAAESAATSERLAREMATREAAARELSAREKALAAWVSAIRNKIRGRILEPVVAQVPGNPEAVYQVTLLPTGEVLNARLVKSSGNSAYDQELQRAIQASSPLPKPDPQSLFQRTLELRFRPKDP
jgi:colicin import membrane protein